MNLRYLMMASMLILSGIAGIGCEVKSDTHNKKKPTTPETVKSAPEAASKAGDEVQTERAKLSPEDLALVKAQEWCVISDDERLGSMGAPIKLDIKGQAVFVCCKGCKSTALANPDKTLAKLAELKAKAAAQPR